MTDAKILNTVDQMIEGGKYAEAQALLSGTDGEAAADVLRVKLAIRQNAIEPATAMQRLVAIMRLAPTTERAQDLYREVSSLAYRSSSSTPAHSHPPPPPKRDE